MGAGLRRAAAVPSTALARGRARRGRAGAAPAGQVVAAALFPDLSIAAVQNARLPGSVQDDRQILLGGVGSDLWHGPADPPDELWMVTDRGPRGRGDDGKDRQSFAIPEYTPMILHVRLGAGRQRRRERGRAARGDPDRRAVRPTGDGPAEPRRPRRAPGGLSGQERSWRTTRAASIRRGWCARPNGDFWIAEEYGPSLVHLDANGMVLKRFVPERRGRSTARTIRSVLALPAIFAKRADDRRLRGADGEPGRQHALPGDAGAALQPEQRHQPIGRGNARILVFDVASEQVTAEYVYRFERIRSFDPSKKADPEDMKISALAMTRRRPASRAGADAERGPALPGGSCARRRTSWGRAGTTRRPGRAWRRPRAWPSSTSLPLVKSAGDRSDAAAGRAGQAGRVSRSWIRRRSCVANDNDFDIGKFDSKGVNDGKGDKSLIVTVELAAAAPGRRHRPRALRRPRRRTAPMPDPTSEPAPDAAPSPGAHDWMARQEVREP